MPVYIDVLPEVSRFSRRTVKAMDVYHTYNRREGHVAHLVRKVDSTGFFYVSPQHPRPRHVRFSDARGVITRLVSSMGLEIVTNAR